MYACMHMQGRDDANWKCKMLFEIVRSCAEISDEFYDTVCPSSWPMFRFFEWNNVTCHSFDKLAQKAIWHVWFMLGCFLSKQSHHKQCSPWRPVPWERCWGHHVKPKNPCSLSLFVSSSGSGTAVKPQLYFMEQSWKWQGLERWTFCVEVWVWISQILVEYGWVLWRITLALAPSSPLSHQCQGGQSKHDVLEEMTWHSIASYFKTFASDEAKKKFKNLSQKKKYITDTLGMPLQFEPRFEKWKFWFGLNWGGSKFFVVFYLSFFKNLPCSLQLWFFEDGRAW